MKPGTRLIISVVSGVLAVALMGAFTFSLAKDYSSRRNKAIKQYGGEMTEVLVAKGNIDEGAEVTPEMVEKRKWVTELLPAGAIDDVAELKDGNNYRKANSRILAGEPVALGRLGDADKSVIALPKDLVAVSIPTEDVLAVGGAIGAGQYVTVIVANGQDEPYVLVRETLVLATSASGARSDSGGAFGGGGPSAGLSWVTLAVPDNLILNIVDAAESARIHLVLAGASAEETVTAQ